MSVIDDLAAVVRAGLEADELWAIEASRERGHLIEGGAHWHWVHGENWEPVTPDPTRGDDLTTNDGEYFCGKLISVEEFPWERGGSSPMYASGWVSTQDIPAAAAGHQARHDPARVLREASSRRALLDEALAWEHYEVEDAWYACPASEAYRKVVHQPPYPCECGRDARVAAVLQHLAQPYQETP